MYTLNIQTVALRLIILAGMVKNQPKVLFTTINEEGEAVSTSKWKLDNGMKQPVWSFLPEEEISKVASQIESLGNFSNYKDFYAACNDAYMNSFEVEAVVHDSATETVVNPFKGAQPQQAKVVVEQPRKPETKVVPQPSKVEEIIAEFEAEELGEVFTPDALPNPESGVMLVSRERRESILEQLEDMTRKQIIQASERLPSIIEMCEATITTVGTKADYDQRVSNINYALRKLGIDGRTLHKSTTTLNQLWGVCFLIKDGLEVLANGGTLTEDPAPETTQVVEPVQESTPETPQIDAQAVLAQLQALTQVVATMVK